MVMVPAVCLRHSTLLWLSLSGVAYAQVDDLATDPILDIAGSIYENSRQDVTLPIAGTTELGPKTDTVVTIPVEDFATPIRCLTAWSYLAGQLLPAPDIFADAHTDFTEATASALWQHWLYADLDIHTGADTAEFHQRRQASERTFEQALADQGNAYLFRTLGACYVPPEDRELADATLLLRNFMVTHQGLSDAFRVPPLQRQLRAFPITEVVESEPSSSCDANAPNLLAAASRQVTASCFARGGILASRSRSDLEDLDGMCRATATVQCESIP